MTRFRPLALRSLLALAVVPMVPAAVAGASASHVHAHAATTSLCAKYAPSKGAIERTIGTELQEPLEDTTFCYIEGSKDSVRIYPFPARRAAFEKSFTLTVFEGKHPKTIHLAHLGKGAALVSVDHGREGDVFFTRGTHFFVLTGGSTARTVAFAHAIYNKA